MAALKKFLYLLTAVVITTTLSACTKTRTQQSSITNTPLPSASQISKAVDTKASFLIFTNATKRDFSASRYHNLSQDVYLESQNPTTVHVTKSGIAWTNLFATLPMKLTKECLTTGIGQVFCTGESGTLKFYLNGAKTDNLLDMEIKNGDKALITFGNETETQIQSQLSKVPTPN